MKLLKIPEVPVMKRLIFSTVAAVLLFASAAMATTMSSQNYASNTGRIVSGGSEAIDVSGMTKAGIAIGQAVYRPPGGSSSPAYTAKPTTLPTASSGSPCGNHSGDINCDGVVDIVDTLIALKGGVGLVRLSSAEVTRGDVGPLVSNVAVGDGKIDIEDAMLILRKAVGLWW